MNEAISAIDTEQAGPLKIKIVGMDCGGCAMTIEDSICKLAGVDDASVSFTTETMEVTGNINMEEIESRLKELGYKIGSNEPISYDDLIDHRGAMGFLRFMWGQPPLRSAICVTITKLSSA